VAASWSAMALACQLLLAVALAAVLAAASMLRGTTIAALIIVEIWAVALLLAVVPLVLGRSMASESVARTRPGQLFRALCRDALAFEIALARMALEPLRTAPDVLVVPPFPSPPCPVLLVHGFGCSRAVWRPLLARLRAAGVGPVRAVSFEPLFAGIERYAGELVGELERLGSRGGGQPITIVAHSMGGLVARAALRGAPPGLIGRIITIGAPHHGTALACWFRWPSARQMRPGSGWLANINGCQEGRLGVPCTTIYSLDDNYIAPACSARFEGAQAIELRGLGHLSLLESKAVLGHVISELLE
jgi:hypothetical protein